MKTSWSKEFEPTWLASEAMERGVLQIQDEMFAMPEWQRLTGLAVVDTTTIQIADSCTGLLVELRRERK